MPKKLTIMALLGLVTCCAATAHAGPTMFSNSYNVFPVGFYSPDASSDSAPFTGAYYVAVAPYADSQDDNLVFSSVSGTSSYFDPTSNTGGTYSSSPDSNTVLTFASLPFTTDAFGGSDLLPDGSGPGTWGGEDIGVALQFFDPQNPAGCFANQTGCDGTALAAYMTAPPVVSEPDPSTAPDVYDITMQIPSGTLIFEFTLTGVDPSTIGYAYTNDTTVNDNATVVLVGSIANDASTVQVVWDSVTYEAPSGGSGGGSGGSSGSSGSTGSTGSTGGSGGGTIITNTASPPPFLQPEDDTGSVPEPATLILLGTGLLLAYRRKTSGATSTTV